MPRTRAPREHLDALARIAALAGCPPRELVAVDRCTTPVSVPAGTVLCREGQVGREAFIIVRGEAAVTVAGRPLALLGAGAICGEMALVERGRRSATVTAVTPMELLAMSMSEFTTLLVSAPCLTRAMLVALSGRLRAADHGG